MAETGRWQRADENFRKQIRLLRAESGMNVTQIAEACGVSAVQMYNYINHPAQMRKRTERYIAMLFEKYGMSYDPTMGEGKANPC